MKNLHEFFIVELHVLSSSAESMHRILKRMSSSATGKEIVEIMDTYYFQSQYQVKKIKQYQSRPTSAEHFSKSFVMRKLADEGQTNLGYQGSWIIRDIALLLTLHKMKHYQRALIGAALHHGELLKAEEGVDLLNTIKQKIAEEEAKPLDLIKSLLSKGKKEDLEPEIIHFLGLMVRSQILEENRVESFLEVFTNRANSEILYDALLTYKEKQQQVKKTLKEIQEYFPGNPNVLDWGIIKEVANECSAEVGKAQEAHLKDLATICVVQRLQHLRIAEYEIQVMLAGFLNKQGVKVQLLTLLENEWGNNQSLNAIAQGSLLKKGLDQRVKK